MAITVIEGVTTASTSNTTSYTSGSFTPAANDQLVAFVTVSASVLTSPTMTDTQSLGWTKLKNQTFDGAAHSIYCFIANNLAAASSMTVTFDCTGDSATGCVIHVVRISGAKTSGGTYKQVQSNFEDASSAPNVVMSSAFLTGNTGVGAMATASNPPGLTPRSSPTWTELVDTGYNSPTHGLESMYIITGETATTITWGSSSPSAWGAIVIEFEPAGAAVVGETTSKLHKLLLGSK